jgi:hypothetical protein
MKRKLGASEHILWLASSKVPSHGVAVIEVSGSLTEAVLRETFVFLQKRHPLLNVEIQLENGEPKFVSVDRSTLLLEIADRPEKHDWLQEVEEEINRLLPWPTGPLTRITWLKSANKQVLAIALHHAISDGISTVYLVRDLLTIANDIMSGKTPNCQPLPERSAIDEMLPERYLNYRGQWVMTKEIVQQVLKHQTPQIIPADIVPPTPGKSGIIYRVLSERATNLLSTYCNREKTTANGAITAMLLRAVARKIDPKKEMALSYFSPVNIRPWLETALSKEELLYGSAGITMFQKVSTDLPFWQLAREIKVSLFDELQRKDGIFFVYPLQKKLLGKGDDPEKFTQMSKSFKPSTFVSNFGKVPIPDRYGNLTLEGLHCFGSVNIISTPCLGVTVIEFKGVAELSFTYTSGSIGKQVAESIVSDALSDLQQALGIANRSDLLKINSNCTETSAVKLA